MSRAQDQERFDAFVEEFLKVGAAKARGWSRAKYVAKCKRLWDECETDAAFRYKVLVDRKVQPTGSALSSFDYFDSRLQEQLENSEDENGLSCVAIGLMRPDGTLDTDQPKHDSSPVESEGSPFPTNYILCLADVLGFSNMLDDLGLRSLHDLYKTVSGSVFERDRAAGFSLARVGQELYSPAIMPIEIGSAYFSDTLLLWVPLLQNHINTFISTCSDVICESLMLGVPLRGAITVGECVIHPRSNTFLGQPLVEAARLEKAQEWIGVSFGLSTLAPGFRNELDSKLILSFPVACKAGRDYLASGIALDWPGRARERGLPPRSLIAELNTKAGESERDKYRNTSQFIDHSRQLADLKEEELAQLRPMDILAAQAVATRRGEDPPDDWEHQLDLAASLGEQESAAASTLRDIAAGREIDELPESLGDEYQEFFAELLAAITEPTELIDLLRVARGVLWSRWEDESLSDEIASEVEKLRDPDSEHAAVARYFDALSDRGKEPSVPDVSSASLQRTLELIHGMSQGDVAPVDLDRLGQEVLDAHGEEADLSRTAQRDLELLSLASDEYHAVASFLEELAAGNDPAPPEDAGNQTRGFVMRLEAATREIFVPSASFPAVFLVDYEVDVDLRDLARQAIHLGRSGKALPGQFKAAIEELIAHGEPHSSAGKKLKAIARQEEADLNAEDLPPVVRWYLMVVESLRDRRPVPIVLDLVGLAAVRSRMTGKGIPGYVEFGFDALKRGSKEAQSAAAFLERVANDEDVPPIPPEVSGEMRNTLEEVRAMAEYGHLFRAAVARGGSAGY